jgi:hypothetical protein
MNQGVFPGNLSEGKKYSLPQNNVRLNRAKYLNHGRRRRRRRSNSNLFIWQLVLDG